MSHACMPDGQRQRLYSHMSPAQPHNRWQTGTLQVTTQWGDGCSKKVCGKWPLARLQV
jgi:hypothetical protein